MMPSNHERHVNADAAKPFLKWAGGKRSLVSQLAHYLPTRFGTYFEPFAGGAAMFFSLAPQAPSVLGDLNEALIGVYTAVRDDVDGVVEALGKHYYDRQHFLEVRKKNFEVGSSVERAADFIFCNRVCFNGLHRVNRAGKFNVPFGRYTSPLICDVEGLRRASAGLQQTVLCCGDFAKTVAEATAGDVVYFDPPYVPVSSTSRFAEYTQRSFPWSEQVRLRDRALELRAKGVHVLLSNADTPSVHKLYSDFNVEIVTTRRAINSDVRKRGPVTELIISG